MTTTNMTAETRRNAGAKAAATKGPFWAKVAGIRASISRLERIKTSPDLSAYERGQITARINAKREELAEMGLVEDAA